MPSPLFIIGVLLEIVGVSSLGWQLPSEVISDLTGPADDERRALEIKAAQFWQPVLDAAEEVKLEEHFEVYDAVERVIAGLPEANGHVRELLSDSLARLKRADAKVLANAMLSSEAATHGLASTAPGSGASSFISGGQNFFAVALERFVHGRYSERLVRHVQQRQAEILPALQSASEAAGNVLGDCRVASKLGFDVLKYDIYDRNASKTPEQAKQVAHQLVDASAQTRRSFMNVVMGAVSSITKDAETKDEAPSSTVARTFTELQPSTKASVGAASSLM